MTRSTPSPEAREVARAAARWLAMMEFCGDDFDSAALQRWRDSSAQHEAAWQKAQRLRQRFAGVPPSLGMATLDRPALPRRAVLKRALGVAALVPTAWLLGRALPLEVWRADLHTATGEQRRWSLADGSALQLNTDSALDLDLKARRLVLVQGEMALNVSRTTPLAIEAPFGLISVSRGEVCVRLIERSCRVSVLSGSVQLQPLRGPMLTMEAGEQVNLQASGAGPVGAFDVAQLGWRDGVLVAQNQPLGDFLRELARYRPGVLRWEEALESLRVTGSFRLENTDRILALLSASLPVQVQMRTRYWVTLTLRNNIA
ncbi:FecR domain-containing protein [Pseudomonas fluorescens]|uniref:FecR domain-containing protein n=1 Tax=Pseudomonas fluorescens TaxID=294 RepID=A0A944DXX2_PSEFL|nr:FecR domain-containing protein [Pseudomonas fluorescens]MBT2298530.1 FecR domain-containing protein [Pseudomonas fluorescens]MBT2310055.1 FecR domain-containing protein [Pseudomonas fluorescens]MBT2311079.1 FecR domain-containing protein [Pseudomonas fluorescens]MBT2319986.1 FecR domain-containing protein [Pseudomonas fluorescens]MBT2328986.1 FecR domain-containing protein [Pseudomonas fluorescens]